MNYEISTRKNGASFIIWGLISLCILGGAIYMAYFSQVAKHPSVIVMTIFSSIWILGSFSLISTGRKQLHKGGSWSVNIDNQGIKWSSPNYDGKNSVDQSFSYSLEEIDYTEKFRTKFPTGKISHHPSYYIHLKDGRVQKIRTNSGIKIENIFEKLEELNISHVDTIGDASKPDIEQACIT